MKILPFLLLDLQANTSSFPVLGGWLHQSATWGEFTYITDLNLVAGPSGNRQGLWFVIWLRPFWWPCSWQSFEFHVCEVGWNYVSSNRKCGNWTLQDSKTECAKDPPDKVIWSGFLSSWTTISGGLQLAIFLCQEWSKTCWCANCKICCPRVTCQLIASTWTSNTCASENVVWKPSKACLAERYWGKFGRHSKVSNIAATSTSMSISISR